MIASRPTDEWLIELLTPILVDKKLLGTRWRTALDDDEAEMRWPLLDPEGNLGSPESFEALNGEVTWGEQIAPSRFYISKVAVSTIATRSGAEAEDCISRLSRFRKSWGEWVGIVTGQATSARWASTSELGERKGITRVAHERDRLEPSQVRTRGILRPGGSVGAIVLDLDQQEMVLAKTIDEPDPPFELWMFHSARESYQLKQHRSAILDMAAAVEVLLVGELLEAGVHVDRSRDTLGKLAKRAGTQGWLSYGEGTPLKRLVDLRNQVVHRPDEPFYNNDTVVAFEAALEQFSRRFPDLFPAPEQRQLLWTAEGHQE